MMEMQEEIKNLILLSKRDTEANTKLENEFINAAGTGKIELIKFLLNEGFKISHEVLKKSIREAVGSRQINILKYFTNKFDFPYDYLTELIDYACEKEQYYLSHKIVALSDLKALDKAALTFALSNVDDNNVVDDNGQNFFRTCLSDLEKMLDTKTLYIIEDIKKIISSVAMINNFIIDKEILNKISDFSKQLKKFNIMTIYDLDLLTEINRLLFKIDIESLQILAFYNESIKGFENIDSPVSIIEEYLDNKGILKIFKALEQIAPNLEKRLSDINKLPLNSVQPRSDVNDRTTYLFKWNPPIQKDVIQKISNFIERFTKS